MATEEQMQAARIGGMRVHNALIRLVDYSAEWPALFVREANRVRATLGDRVLMLEHVGSTSVPGLAAKPIIDMILAVADSADEPAYVPAMESAGYLLHIREPEWHQHRLFRSHGTDINLHVYSFGCPEMDKMLMFRDWLRTNDADAALSLVAIRLSLRQSVAATVQSLAFLFPSARGTKTVAPHRYGPVTVPVSCA